LIERRLYPSGGLHGQVAHDIGRRVVSGEIAEGTFLPREAELAAQFCVSRQAIREALKVLAAKGLVHSRRRTGTIVLPRSSWNLLDPDVLAWHPPERLQPEFLNHLIELRRVIEPAAAALAAERGSREAIAAIGAALADMQRTLDDRPEFIRADVAFHSAICAASGNVFFERIGEACGPLLVSSFALQGRKRDRDTVAADTLPIHVLVYEAIAGHDPQRARKEMENLLSRAVVEVGAIDWPKAIADDSHAE